ncbi:MAG TPA: hypothetical protein PK239_03725 [Chitinophagales bacterium]|nr:hypothetical protein [Chitinophagales bacterium]HRK26380.1 hypothetical protein [Chitinophagales bacterium]
MSPYNPNIHHRRSIRLKGYNYAQAGLYFITICCQDRICRFGSVVDGKMILNDAGRMVEKWYYELENKFPDIRCHEMVVMPNHFHCIIENIGTVGADLRVCPNTDNVNADNVNANNVNTDNVNANNVNTDNVNTDNVNTNNVNTDNVNADTNPIEGEHVGSPLHRVVQWFKTMTTNEYIRGVKNLGWQPFDGKLWQRNYYEHIIRNETAYQNISLYIINNPAKWATDKFYKL